MMGRVPSDGGDALVGACIALSVLQIVFVAARFFTRYLQQARCGLDDYVILIALIGSIAKAVVYIVLVEVAGLGYHFDNSTHSAENIALIRKGFFVVEILDFPFTVTPAKLSLLLFYMRIFYTRNFKITAYVVGSLVLGLGIAVLFETIFQCSPIAYGWDRSIQHGKCIDQILFYRTISPINVLTAVMILIMPIPLVWRLQAPRGQKIALTVIFVLGGLGFVASILRLTMYYLNTRAELNNVTWFPVKLGILTVVEGTILIITACLVSIWPLVARICPRRLVNALSCAPRARQHRGWYMTTRRQNTSDEHLTRDERDLSGRDGRWDSTRSFDVEEQRSWLTVEGLRPGSCEERVIDHEPKVHR